MDGCKEKTHRNTEENVWAKGLRLFNLNILSLPAFAQPLY